MKHTLKARHGRKEKGRSKGGGIGASYQRRLLSEQSGFGREKGEDRKFRKRVKKGKLIGQPQKK